MGIDASIYSNVKPVQMDIPQPLDIAQKQLALSSLGLQQQQMALNNLQMQRQIQTQQAVRQSLANNTDQNGNINQSGFLSDLGKVNPQAALDYQGHFAQLNEQKAKAQAAQLDAADKTYNITGPAFDYLASLPEDQRASAYSNVIAQLKDQGVDVSRMDHPYDPAAFRQYYGTWQQSKPHLANLLTQSEIGKNNADKLKTGAEELGKYSDSINDPSNRKTIGGLTDIINRSQRIKSLLNAGAQPNETPEQRVARLDKLMPQIGTEVGLATAGMLNGAVPTEGLTKEITPDTIQGRIAELKQKYTAEPTAANQGKLLEAYGDIADRLGNWASTTRQSTIGRMRAAFPYANQYFSKEMDKVTPPMISQDAPPASSESKGSPKSGKSPGYASGSIVMYKGRHYRVGADGDSLEPVGGR